MSRVATPKVPGEVTTDAPVVVETAVSEAAKPVTDAPAADSNASAAETVTVEKTQLDALLAQVAELSNKVRSIEAAKPVTGKRINPTENLPDQDDVDPNTLQSPVLTKQGWQVPNTFGSNPNAPKAF